MSVILIDISSDNDNDTHEEEKKTCKFSSTAYSSVNDTIPKVECAQLIPIASVSLERQCNKSPTAFSIGDTRVTTTVKKKKENATSSIDTDVTLLAMHDDIEIIDTVTNFKTKTNQHVIPEEDYIFPDLHSLFIAYDSDFFGSVLKSVEVRWSSRMTLCAGLCRYERGGYCSIRLSEPLLKYRSVKEYRETLLHEMIHAYLFLTQNNRDRDGHGYEFQKLMNKINFLTVMFCLNITIYHSFADEVNHYRVHVWKCNGPCQFWKPRFGLVKRAMNRPPGPADFWWSQHLRVCGGKYTKISSPINSSKVQLTRRTN